MSKVYTTEIASEQIPSDNPIHQRLLKAYVLARDYVAGDVLEVGCGEGRGIDLTIDRATSFSAIDKIASVIAGLAVKYPQAKFYCDNIPPMKALADDSYDLVLSFQVIEHIKNDRLFLQEIRRVLKPGGQALLTTPNRPKSISRNPWHVREYTAGELTTLASTIFSGVEMKGIGGNEKVMQYYERNRKSVSRIMRYDIFDLQWRLPSSILRVPYELLNRWNRDKLQADSDGLVSSIRHTDYTFMETAEEALDLLLIVKK